MGRLGARNITELLYWATSVEHEDDEGAITLLDLLEAFPSSRREGLWGFYEELRAPSPFILFCQQLYADAANLLIIEAQVFSGPVQYNGMRQGSRHSTTDLLLATELVARK